MGDRGKKKSALAHVSVILYLHWKSRHKRHSANVPVYEWKLEGKPSVPARAFALSKEMFTTQNIPNKFRFSVGRKLIGIPQKMIKTVLTVFTALVKADVKSRNSILGFTENPFVFFTAILKDFHSEGDLTVYLFISRQKQKQKKTKTTATKNIWSVIYRIGRYISGSKFYVIWLSFCGSRTWCFTNDFTEQANKSALHDSLSDKQSYFIVLMVFSELGALVAAWLKEKERSLGPYTSYRAKIYQSLIERLLNHSINKYQLPTCKCTNSPSSGHKTLRSLVFFSLGHDRV